MWNCALPCKDFKEISVLGFVATDTQGSMDGKIHTHTYIYYLAFMYVYLYASTGSYVYDMCLQIISLYIPKCLYTYVDILFVYTCVSQFYTRIYLHIHPSIHPSISLFEFVWKVHNRRCRIYHIFEGVPVPQTKPNTCFVFAVAENQKCASTADSIEWAKSQDHHCFYSKARPGSFLWARNTKK